MFVGHYAAAFALKGKEKNSSLGLLFIATQFVDVLFFPFAVLGWEKMEFVAGFTAVNDFKMEFPFTHGLLATIIWSLIFGGIYYLVWGRKKIYGKTVAIVLGMGVLSHWFADLLVHTPDLPLVHGEPKFGFGLWQNKLLTMLLEAMLLILGLWYYLRKTIPTSNFGKYASVAMVFLLLLINYLNYYVLPANHDLQGLMVSALITFFVLAALAEWIDSKRA